VKRLWILCLLSVAGTPIYSPKYAEHVRSLQKVSTTTTKSLIVPKLVQPPPDTNRYYLTMSWDTNCTNTATFAWGTNNSYQHTNIFSGGSCNISNLVKGAVYRFLATTNACATSNTFFYFFPPPQLPYTNTVTITCTGHLQMANGLKGPWVDTTNKVFNLTQNQTAYWRSKAKETIKFSMVSNQTNWSQYLHKQ